MEPNYDKLLEWRKSLNERECALHDLASVKLKKTLNSDAKDGDQGSYFPERSKAFQQWLKSKSK